MTLLFYDGFETYDPAATSGGLGMLDEIRDVWMADDESDLSGATISIEASDRTPGEQLLQVISGSQTADLGTSRTYRFPLAGLSDEDDLFFGAAFASPDGLNGINEFTTLFLLGDYNGRMLDLRLRGNGDILLQRTNPPGATVTIDSAVGAWNAGQWNYIELYVKLHSSAGEYEVRLDGTAIMSGTGANTSNTGGTRAFEVIFGHVQNKRWQVDDFYVADDVDATATQGAANNTFLNPDTTAGGNLIVQRVRPNAVGDDSDFTPSAAVDHYTLVDEDAEDDDASHVESRTAAEKDLYHFEDLAGDVADIFAVIAKPVLRKTDGGSRTYRLLAKSGATEVDSGTRYPSVSYVRQTYLWPVDPDTGALWTVAGFNAAQFGLEIVS